MSGTLWDINRMTITNFISLALLTSVVWLCAVWPNAVNGQDELLQGEPFDELLLKDEKKVLKLVPMEMKPRRPIVELKLKADDDIVVRLLERPGRPYKVKWSEVKSVRLFEEMLLDRASRLAEMGQFDLAVESITPDGRRD